MKQWALMIFIATSLSINSTEFQGGSKMEGIDNVDDYMDESVNENDDPGHVAKSMDSNVDMDKWSARRNGLTKQMKRNMWKEIRREVRNMKKNILPGLGTSNISWMEPGVREMNHNFFTMIGDVRFIKNEILYIKQQAHVIWENVTDTRRDHKRMNKTLWWILTNVTLVIEDVGRTARQITELQDSFNTVGPRLDEVIKKIVTTAGVEDSLRQMNSEFGAIKSNMNNGLTRMTEEINIVREIIGHLGQTIVDVKEYVLAGFTQIDHGVAASQGQILSNVTDVGSKLNNHGHQLAKMTDSLVDIAASLFTFSEQIINIWNLVVSLTDRFNEFFTNFLDSGNRIDQINEGIRSLGGRVVDIHRRVSDISTQLGSTGTQVVSLASDVNHHFDTVNVHLGSVHERIISNVSVVRGDLNEMKNQLRDIRQAIVDKCVGNSIPPGTSGTWPGQVTHSWQGEAGIKPTTSVPSVNPPRPPTGSQVPVNPGIPLPGAHPGIPGTGAHPGIPGTGAHPGIPGTGVHPGIPGTGAHPGIPGTGAHPGIPGTGVHPGIPGTGAHPGIPGTGVHPGIPGTGAHPGIPGTGAHPGIPGTGAHPGMPGTGVHPGIPETGVHPPNGNPTSSTPSYQQSSTWGPGFGYPSTTMYPPASIPGYPTYPTMVYPPFYPYPPITGYPPVYPPPVYPQVPPGYPMPGPYPPPIPPNPGYPPAPNIPSDYYPSENRPPMTLRLPLGPAGPGIPIGCNGQFTHHCACLCPCVCGYSIVQPNAVVIPSLQNGQKECYCLCSCPCPANPSPIIPPVHGMPEHGWPPHVPTLPPGYVPPGGTPEWSGQPGDNLPTTMLDKLVSEVTQMRQDMTELERIIKFEHANTREIIIDANEKNFNHLVNKVDVFFKSSIELHMEALEKIREMETQLYQLTDQAMSSFEIITSTIINLHTEFNGIMGFDQGLGDRLSTYLTEVARPSSQPVGNQPPNFTPPGYRPSYLPSRPYGRPPGRPQLLPTNHPPYRPTLDSTNRPSFQMPTFPTNRPPFQMPTFSTNRPPFQMPLFSTNSPPYKPPPFLINHPPYQTPSFSANRPPYKPPPFPINRPPYQTPSFSANRPPYQMPQFSTNRPPFQMPSFSTNRPPYKPPPFPINRPSFQMPQFSTNRPPFQTRPFPTSRPPHKIPPFPINRPPYQPPLSPSKFPSNQWSMYATNPPSYQWAPRPPKSSWDESRANAKEISSTPPTNGTTLSPLEKLIGKLPRPKQPDVDEKKSELRDHSMPAHIKEDEWLIGSEKIDATPTTTTTLNTTLNVTERIFPIDDNGKGNLMDERKSAGKEEMKSTKKSVTKNEQEKQHPSQLIAERKFTDYEKPVQESFPYNVEVVPDGMMDVPDTEIALRGQDLNMVEAPMDPFVFNNLIQRHINQQLMNAFKPISAYSSKRKHFPFDRWHGKLWDRFKLPLRPIFPMLPGFPLIPPPIQFRPPIHPIVLPNPLVPEPPQLPNIFDQLPPDIMTAGINNSPYSISYNDGNGNSWNVNVNRRHFSGMKSDHWNSSDEEEEEEQNELEIKEEKVGEGEEYEEIDDNDEDEDQKSEYKDNEDLSKEMVNMTENP